MEAIIGTPRATSPSRKVFSRFVGVALASVFVGSLASPALAVDTVTQSVTGGGVLSASVADSTLAAVGYSHAVQNQTGSMTLTADDSTGSGDGWNVTVLTGAFAHDGDGAAIPAANLALTSAATPSTTAGQAVDVTAGPKVPDTTPVGSLDSARKVVQADDGFGKGTYTQDLGIDLTIPAQTLVGTYTGTLVTSITAAP